MRLRSPFGSSSPLSLVAFAALAALAVGACAESKPAGKYPPQKPGCEVQVFPEEPSYPTENIGTVNATCDEAVSEAACLTELKDQACKLGADTVWGVGDEPSKRAGKVTRSGRAAHRK